MGDTIFFLVVAGAISYVVLSPKINEGVLYRIGFTCVAFAFIGAAMISVERGGGYVNSMYLIGFGALICVVGFLWRWMGKPCKKRRAQDWVKF